MKESTEGNCGLKNNKNAEFVHFQKINIFGDSGVGKSSFISYLENYDNYNYSIETNIVEKNDSIDSFDMSSSIVEQINRLIIDLNEDRNLYFYIYETNLDKYDNIKINLDTLLIQTECIIIMWDYSNPETFDNIPNFVSTIKAGFNDYKFREAPIIVIQNKMDKKDNVNDNEVLNINESIENFKKENPNILYQELTLLDKDAFYNLILEIYKKMEILEKDLNLVKDKFKKEDDIINNVKFKKKISNLNMSENNSITNTVNCTLLGNSTVGKTTYINYLLKKEVMETLPTIGISSTSFIAEVFNEKIYFKLTDTAGQEKYNSIPFSQYKNSDGILLFFDVTNEESFKKINYWIENIKTMGEINKHFELFLIANKIDQSDKRKVFKKEAKELADKYNIKYFECSCLYGINVYELFNEITLMAYEKYNSNDKQNLKSLVIYNKRKKSINKKGKGKGKGKGSGCC